MEAFWRDKKVFVTGHTGFKGSWLCLWLQSMGAEVIGYALSSPSQPSLFNAAGIGIGMHSVEADVLDYPQLESAIKYYQPDIIIHMAAQALVRYSYKNPLETLGINIMGTANVLEAARQVNSIKAVLCVTSDKCYENQEWIWGYRENEPMGGRDPYSCSKGCAELVVSSYRQSFFSGENSVSIASVRAGNVIGGGDWAADRIIPDCIRAVVANNPIIIRSPGAIRPWQHVLEPLTGYLVLAQKLWSEGSRYAEGWNFGPYDQNAQPVSKIVDALCSLWGDNARWEAQPNSQMHEAHYLKLDSSKAMHNLGWRPVLDIKDTIAMTVDWYKRFYQGEDPRKLTLEQIRTYQRKRKEQGHVS